jgi:hypothetical protein
MHNLPSVGALGHFGSTALAPIFTGLARPWLKKGIPVERSAEAKPYPEKRLRPQLRCSRGNCKPDLTGVYYLCTNSYDRRGSSVEIQGLSGDRSPAP